jgi:hypothetical protein
MYIAEEPLSPSVSLLSGFAKPLHCFDIILGDPLTVVVCIAEPVLSVGMSLLSSLAIPRYCFAVVLRDSFAVVPESGVKITF